jgi:energy-coupling factor transport system ATP-binding protein
MIAGIAFGGETGFVVGAVSMLVSNIYFGQGAWTPWQMFAAGIIGFLAGVIFNKNLLPKNRIAISITGFIFTVVIYGGIMNFSSLIMTRTPVNPGTIITFMLQGLPLDLIHALSTLVVLFLLSTPMLKKLDRVKTKYGLVR